MIVIGELLAEGSTEEYRLKMRSWKSLWKFKIIWPCCWVFRGGIYWSFYICINVPMSWRISSFVSISCSSFSSGESRSEFKINSCQFVRVFANLWPYCNWLFGHKNGHLVHVLELSLDVLLESKNHRKSHTVATVYVNEMKAIFYSTIRAFGRREADLITPKRLGFANAIRFQNYLILNQKKDFRRII